MSIFPRILVFNRCQFDDSSGRGGGVSVYLRSLLKSYLESGYDVTFLSAGTHYDIVRREVYWQRTSNIFEHKGLKSFEIVNSPIKAPAHDSFFQIGECLENPDILTAFVSFMDGQKEFDEIHFHNIEGITTEVVSNVAGRNNLSVFVWFHNYHWICPQIDLFKNNATPCQDFNRGKDCVTCLPRSIDVQAKINRQRVSSALERSKFLQLNLFRSAIEFIRKWYRSANSRRSQDLHFADSVEAVSSSGFFRLKGSRLDEAQIVDLATPYQRWRSRNLAILNENAIHGIAVSNLARDKLIEYGVRPDKITAIPLGMEIYNPSFISLGARRVAQRKGRLRVGFLGYSKPSKGLPFLCAALSENTKISSQDLSLHIYSRLDESVRSQISVLSKKIELTVTEGYDRDQLASIANDLDVVVVPSLWWETYNQVAYEMVMQGVAVVASNSVGVSAYLNKNYVFRSGDSDHLIEILSSLAEQPAELAQYWRPDEFKLSSFDQHFANLQHCVKQFSQQTNLFR